MSCLVRRAVLNLRSNFTGNRHLWTSGSNATGLYGLHRLKFPQEKPVSCLVRRAVLNLRLNFTGTRHLSNSGSDAAGLYGFHRLNSPQGFQRFVDDAIKRKTWSVNSSMDSSRFNSSPGNSSSGPSRLVKIIKDFQIKLFARFEEIKNEFPMKLLLFLVGFYCATGFATVIGQTGDWDVLAAGLAVIVVEGIGALMYNNSFPLLRKIKNFVSMFNFWKAGVTMGLFLDAFKYKIDDIFVLPVAPINFDIDVFRMFL